MPLSSDRVAVIVPLSKKTGFSPSEKISIRHLTRFLGRYPKFFLAPNSSSLRHEDFEMAFFPETFFGSVKAHNTLLMSDSFYKAFSGYEFIMIHHLDSLVFSDQLDIWCSKELDLVAPPWIPGSDVPWLAEPGVGNGGLSLRRVESFRRVLRSKERWHKPGERRGAKGGPRGMLRSHLRRLKDFRYHFRYRNGITQEIKAYLEKGGNEDRFWWKRGRSYYPGFRIAPIEVALQFGFEANPRKCLELNGGKMPFGCHAWERYDRSFWEPFVLAE